MLNEALIPVLRNPNRDRLARESTNSPPSLAQRSAGKDVAWNFSLHTILHAYSLSYSHLLNNSLTLDPVPALPSPLNPVRAPKAPERSSLVMFPHNITYINVTFPPP